MERKTALLALELESLYHSWDKVADIFTRHGLAKFIPNQVSNSSAFGETIDVMQARGNNPKVRAGVKPLREGYKVYFKTSWANVGKTEMECSIMDTPAEKSGTSAICRQIITFNAPDTLKCRKPDDLPAHEYDPNYMVAAFRAQYEECKKVHAEAIRRKIQEILPQLQPLWIKGRTVCWFNINQYDLCERVVSVLNELNPTEKAYVEKLDWSEENPHRVEKFVSAVANHVGSEVAKVRETLTNGKGKREKTYSGFSTDIATLRNTISYYQLMLGVANDAIASYTSQLDAVDAEIATSLAQSLALSKAPASPSDASEVQTASPAPIAPTDEPKAANAAPTSAPTEGATHFIWPEKPLDAPTVASVVTSALDPFGGKF